MSKLKSSYRSNSYKINTSKKPTYIILMINKNVHTNLSIFRCFWTPFYFCSKKPIISSKCHQKKQNPQSCKEASKKYPHTQFHYQSYVKEKKCNYLRRNCEIKLLWKSSFSLSARALLPNALWVDLCLLISVLCSWLKPDKWKGPSILGCWWQSFILFLSLGEASHK